RGLPPGLRCSESGSALHRICGPAQSGKASTQFRGPPEEVAADGTDGVDREIRGLARKTDKARARPRISRSAPSVPPAATNSEELHLRLAELISVEPVTHEERAAHLQVRAANLCG